MGSPSSVGTSVPAQDLQWGSPDTIRTVPAHRGVC